MVAGPFDLTAATEARLEYQWWLRSEAAIYSILGDRLILLASSDGSIWQTISSNTGDWGDVWWSNETVLDQYCGGPVWLRFAFLSDGWVVRPRGEVNGAFLDNVRIVAEMPDAPTGPTGATGVTGPTGYTFAETLRVVVIEEVGDTLTLEVVRSR